MDSSITYTGMNDIVYIDLDTPIRQDIPRGVAVIRFKNKEAMSLKINKAQASELVSEGFIYVRLAVSQITGGIFLVFRNRDEPGSIKASARVNDNYYIYSKALAEYIIKRLGIKTPENGITARISIGENQANKKDIRTFRLDKI